MLIRMSIKAIPTELGGVTYRSRLEARWAAFFDALGADPIFEHQGYEVHGKGYLPDFYLAAWKVYVEVKPAHPGAQVTDKLWALDDWLRTKAKSLYTPKLLLVCGEPLLDKYRVYAREFRGNVGHEMQWVFGQGAAGWNGIWLVSVEPDDGTAVCLVHDPSDDGQHFPLTGELADRIVHAQRVAARALKITPGRGKKRTA